MASLSFGGVYVLLKCFYKHRLKSSKNKIQSLLLIGCVSYSVYFVLAYFIYIRHLASNVAAHNLIAPLVANQFGRMSLVIGSMLLRRSFYFLPEGQTIFIILLYGLGVYSLAFRVS